MNLFLRKIVMLLFVVVVTGSVGAQVFVETYPPSGATDMGVRISGLGNLSDRLSYDKITGSPFWSDEWQLASLFGNNEKEKWLCKAKLNFATGEVYFLDKDGNEQALDDGMIRKVLFYKANDTGIVIAEFILNPQTVKLNQEVRNSYLQVLNAGPYELLKLTKRTLSSADSLFGTLKRYFFTTENNYFLNHDQLLTSLRKLDKENVLSFLPRSSAYTDWIKQNKINFKKEEDVLMFLNYYNSKK